MNPSAFEIPSLLMATVTLTVSAIVALIILRWLKPSSHRIHRAIWIAVLVNGIVLTRVSIDLPVLDHDFVENQTSLRTSTNESVLNDNTFESADEPIELDALRSSTKTTDTINSKPDDVVAASPPAKTESSTREPGMDTATNINWSMLAVVIWFTGMCCTFSIFLVRYLLLIRSLSLAVPATAEWSKQNESVSRDLNIGKTIPLRVHPAIGPALVATPQGYRILVPQTFWQNLSSEQRNCVLKHEYTHYRRSDIWKSFLATAMAIPHWFNPFAWLAVRHFQEAAEWACDEAVSEHDGLEKTGFARALLSLSTSNPTHLLGASAMANSDLTTRVQRLFVTQAQDTLVRRVSLMALIVAIVALGWINIRLVAGPPVATNPIVLASVQEDDEPQLAPKIETMAGKIDVADEIAKQFVGVLKTPAGKVAVSNRVSVIEGEMRRRDSEAAIPEFFANLTPDDHNKIKEAVALAQHDIEQLDTALTNLKTQMNGETEADQMLTRLLEHENAPEILYFSRMRQQMRPGRARLMQRLGRFLADDGSGKLVVRESARDELEKQLGNINAATKHLAFVQKELKSWSDEVFEEDELHKIVKKGLGDPNLAARVLSMSIGRSGMDQQKPAEQYFRFLESILEDGPEGLVIPEEKRAYVEEAIASSKLEREKFAALRQPIDEIADLIVDRGESEKLVKDFLKSEIGKCVIVKDFDYRAASAEGAVDQIKTAVLEENSDGYLVRDEMQEQVLEFVKNTLREARRFRRHTRILDPHINELDSQWRAIYDSAEGRAVTIDKIKELVEARQYDAWPAWINRHFEEVDGKYVVLEEAQAPLQEIIQEARAIETELEKNDF